MGLEYGITDHVTIGIGRSYFEKTFDAFGKYRFLRQQKGKYNIPVSMVFFSSIACKTLRDFNTSDEGISLTERLSYTNQIVIAKKVNSSFSLQLMPTMVHRNTVVDPRLDNTYMHLEVE